MSGSEQVVRFEYAKMLQELEHLQNVAHEFLTPDAADAIKSAVAALKRHRTTPIQEPLTWATAEHLSIRTKRNGGRHQPGHRGITLYGAVEFTWEIKNIVLGGKKKKRAKPYQYFQLAGLASTRVYLYGDDDKLCGRWNVDIASANAPGCYFHIQLPEKEAPWQYGLDIPRWPSVLFTPADAVDFVLGELFSEAWQTHRERMRHSDPHWRKVQKERLERTLKWMHSTVASADKAPWLTLRDAYPPANLVIDKE